MYATANHVMTDLGNQIGNLSAAEKSELLDALGDDTDGGLITGVRVAHADRRWDDPGAAEEAAP